jgi:hypothetical protein
VVGVDNIVVVVPVVVVVVEDSIACSVVVVDTAEDSPFLWVVLDMVVEVEIDSFDL